MERLIPLKVPTSWFSSVPNRQAEAVDRRRELQMRIANETPQERAKRKKLTPKERKSLLGLKEPERGIAWMRMVFERDETQEVTQMEFWTAYKEEFSQHSDGVPLQPAADSSAPSVRCFLKQQPWSCTDRGHTAAFRYPRHHYQGQDIDLLEPFRCHWSTCPAPKPTRSSRSEAMPRPTPSMLPTGAAMEALQL